MSPGLIQNMSDDKDISPKYASKSDKGEESANKKKKTKEKREANLDSNQDGDGENPTTASRDVDANSERRPSQAEQNTSPVDGGPGLEYMPFIVMEDLADKLKLLGYEEDFCKPLRMKPLSRHYFVYAFNTGEQFYMFTSLAAWLLRRNGLQMAQPQEYDDPNLTVSTLMELCRQHGLQLQFPASRLKQGSGEQVVYIIDRLADGALRGAEFRWQKPVLPAAFESEDEPAADEDEITTEKVSEDLWQDEDGYSEDEQAVMNLDDLRHLGSTRGGLADATVAADALQRPGEVLESTTSGEQWRLELERVLPQLRVQVRSDVRDWRVRLCQMHQHRADIDTSLQHTHSLLDSLHADISGTLQRIANREKYLNSQLEHQLTQLRAAYEQRRSVQERYQMVSGGVVERSQRLQQLTEDLEVVKRELEERGASMTDGTPLVNIRKALTRVRQEILGMDVRIGVVEHTLLQFRLRDKHALQQEANQLHTSHSIGLY